MENERERGSKPSVLYAIPDQFGYSAGYYYYCKYLLKAGYRVGVVCGDSGFQRMTLDGDFEVYYINASNPLLYRVKWFSLANRLSKKYDIVILKQMYGLSLGVFLFDRKKTIFDIRTGSVRENRLEKFVENLELKLLIKYFKRTFILSHELAAEFKIPSTKYIWLPLGADEIAHKKKNYVKSMNLLYVGTFNGRRIHQAIEGFALFYNVYRNKIDITFDIVGDGSDMDKQLINEAIKHNNLKDKVYLHGYLPHQAAQLLFEKCNVGVSYIPVIPCYDNQPPTKTFEYIISGLVCIGTATKSNSQIINNINGILHKDTPEDFCRALIDYFNIRSTFTTASVKMTLDDNKWENIVNKIIIPYLLK